VGTLLLIFLSVFGGLTAPATNPAPPPSTGSPESEGAPGTGAQGTGGGAVPSGTSGSAFVVGDSLAVGVEPHLADLLPGWRIQTSASIGKETSEGVAEITGGKLPPVLVVSLGTNDDPSAVSTFQSQIERVLRAAGPGRCVVWANIVRPPYQGVSYAGYNRTLARTAAVNPNLVLVDWAGMVSRNPGLVSSSDGVHATPSGYEARARAVAAAMQSCGAGYGGAGAGVPLPED
jgi:hypothetical protein